ncbi:hypothetical protein EDD85DRAFT_161174 [Armillaria nabsnona]|nr:hypothetical protein EDD85DRAFT_161174 [Armillaria nabsnona]
MPSLRTMIAITFLSLVVSPSSLTMTWYRAVLMGECDHYWLQLLTNLQSHKYMVTLRTSSGPPVANHRSNYRLCVIGPIIVLLMVLLICMSVTVGNVMDLKGWKGGSS